MKRFIYILLIFSVISLLAEKNSPLAEEIMDMETPEIEWKLPEVGVDIERIELPSGAVLFMKENHSIPLIEINIYIKGGHSFMKAGEQLIAMLFATMIERGGTENISPEDFTERLEVNAIRFNIEENSYYYSVNMLVEKSVLNEALNLLEEALFHPAFDDEVMEIEKRNIKEEWKKTLDEPNSLLNVLSDFVLYRDHPSGEMPDVKIFDNTNKEMLIKLQQRFIQPSNMTVGIVGDFSIDKLRSRLSRLFREEYNSKDTPGEIPELPEESPAGIYFYDKKIPQVFFQIQHRGKKAPFSGMYDIQVMNHILGGGGFTSRILLKVRNEEGLAYRTRSYYSSFSPVSGEFYAYCGTRPDAAHLASEYILDEIEKIRKEVVTDREIRVAKESIKNSTVTRLGNDWNYMQRLMSLDVLDIPLDYYVTLSDSIDKVLKEDIRKAAEDYIHPEKLFIVIIGDRDKINLEAFRKQFGTIEFIELKGTGI